MKKFYTLVLLISIWSILNAQTTFERVLNDPSENYEIAKDLCVNSNGEILVLTRHNGGSSVYKLSAVGDTIWNKKLVYKERKVNANRICVGVDGGYLIAGELVVNNFTDIYLLKIDEAGNKIWDKIIGNSDNFNYCNDLVALPGDGYLLCGIIPQGASQPFFMKLNGSGEIQWENNNLLIDGFSSKADIHPLSISIASGAYFIGGEYDDTVPQAFLMKFDLDGNQILNSKTTSGKREYLKSIHHCQDGSIAFTGYREYVNNSITTSKIWLGKYDENGNLLWEKELKDNNKNFGFDIAEDADGNLNIAGVVYTNDANETPYLAKFDAAGNLIWERYFGSDTGGYLNRLLLQGNFYYGVGYHWANSEWGYNYGNDKAYVLKTDLKGNVNDLRIIPSNTDHCEGVERELMVYGFMESFNWTTDLDIIKTKYNIRTSQAGEYSVSSVDKNGNTRQSNIYTIYSNPNPNILFTDDSKFCGEGDKSLTTEKEYDSYQWFFTDNQSELTSIGDTKTQLVNQTGDYRVQVVDENACKNVVVANDNNLFKAYESTELVAFVADSSNISRAGLADGSATIGVSGGNPPYSYLWEETESTSNSGNNLKANTFYHVTVFDDRGCQTRVTFMLKVVPVVENNLCSFSKVGGDLQLYNTDIQVIENDFEGKIWFATVQEIGMFDGKNWSTINSPNVYQSIQKDKNGNLWCGANENDRGLNKYDGNSWTSFFASNGLAGNNIRDIKEDKYGNLWIATDAGLSRFDGSHFTNFTKGDGLIDNDLYSIHIDKKNRLWIGNYNGITRFNILSNTQIDSCRTFYNAGTQTIGGIKNIEEDKEGNIWASSNWVSEGESGLLKFDGSQWSVIHPGLSMKLTFIYDIYCDTQGGVWVATDKGVGYFDGSNWHAYTKENGLLSNKVSAIGEDLLGYVWIGYNPGEGLSKYSNGEWLTINTASELLNNGIKCNILDSEKNIWVCLESGSYLLQKYDGTNWKTFTEEDGFTGYCYDLASDSKSNVWIATDQGLYKESQNSFVKKTSADGLFADKVLGVCVDKNENVWLRYEDGSGISKFSNGQFMYYTKNEGLLDNHVRDLQADSLGNIWISYNGVFDKQLSKYDGQVFTHMEAPTNSDGIQNPIEKLFVDAQNRVWVSYQNKIAVWSNDNWSFYGEGEHGVSAEFTLSSFGQDAEKNVIVSFYKDLDSGTTEQKLVKFTGTEWINFTANNGLPRGPINCVQDDYQGHIWYGTTKGLLKFTKCTNEEVLISVNNGTCTGEGKRSLIITPTGGNHPYQYSIDNGNNFQTDSIFSDLKAGSYHLLVKNKNGELITNRELSITDPIPLEANVEGINVTCKGRTDGVAICKPSGGMEPYVFLWDDENSSTGARIENLKEGVEYTVTVTDTNGCTAIASLSIGHDPLLKFTDWKNVTCSGLNDGMAVITPIGGKAPFQYQWDDVNNTTDSIVTTLSGDKYHFVSVSDANNCVSIDSIKLNQPEEILINVNKFNSCDGENTGGAELSVSGGVLPYSFQWDDANHSTSKQLYKIAAGSYNVLVKDYSGCEKAAIVAIEKFDAPQVVDIVSNKGEYFCPDNTELSPDGDFASYKWSTGSTDKVLIPEREGKYWLRVFNEDKCSAIDTINIKNLSTYQDQNICIISVTPDNKNEIVWERRNGFGIDSYNVYKESNAASQYELLANVPFDEISVFKDQDSDPTSRSHTYAISVVDVCGLESDKSEAHRTMLLQASYGVNGAINLAWNKYLGLDFDTYYIYRGTSVDQMELLTSISDSESKYIDNNAPEEEFLYYVLQIEAPDVCEPNVLKSSFEEYGVSRSNTIDAGNKVTGIKDKDEMVDAITIYPNPMVDRSYAEFKNSDFKEYTLSVIDSRGSVVYLQRGITGNKVEIPRGNLATGQYIIELRGEKIFRGRLIVK
ncbi:two-component regulator propeller domain-containing protein [Ancylomarina longa]|uniref:Secretion system C-terminal sorting domain-containing protein n=1 Tax=Ancylomarina longa TaxID=2487017 RepID=A0A434AFK0_9BACT|nr:two-component regulator propeller domain-containing protein [Ancylomarina longa]RUT73140.1 hypothetical protein DLK05_14755 [Ancylomarina longa]